MNNMSIIHPPARELVLRVRICMARRDIKSVAELHRRLIFAGVEISHPQLIRIVDNKAKHWSVPLLNGLLQVLDCTLTDLIGEVTNNLPDRTVGA
jgi:DNA-binding Xre family transcriptional regulator